MRGLEHVGFTVSDLQRSIAFYSVLFRDEPISRHTYDDDWVANIVGYKSLVIEAAFFTIPGTEVLLELVEYQHPVGARVDMETYNTGNGHLCLVVEDLTSEFDRLQHAGAHFRHSEPVDMPVGQDTGKSIYLRDPDGITIQLIETTIVGPSRFT